jgi:ureidoglycolate lyase
VTRTQHLLNIERLTPEAFGPYGDVIEARTSAQNFTINGGFAQRFHDLARLDVSREGGYPIISIFKCKPREFPLHIKLLERHPIGSQAFIAMEPNPFLVVVAEASTYPRPNQIRCFQAAPGQGVNYAPGTWHHPLIALQTTSSFLVIDRGGKAGESNCDEYPLSDTAIWIKGAPI